MAYENLMLRSLVQGMRGERSEGRQGIFATKDCWSHRTTALKEGMNWATRAPLRQHVSVWRSEFGL